MIIRNIESHNYRQFQGKTIIEFPLDSRKNICVIKGKTGAGKSCIYNMFHWVFYNKDIVSTRNVQDDVEPLLNTQVFNDLEIGDSGKVSVKISLGDAEKTNIVIERHQSIKKTSDKKHQKKDNIWKIMELKDGNFVPITDTQQKSNFINKIFPEEICELFLFDGEKLDDFFDPKGSTAIQRFVKLATGLDIIDRAINHLKAINKNLDKTDKFDNIELIKIRAKIASLEGKIEKNEKREKLLEKESSDLIIEIEEGERSREEIQGAEEKTAKLKILKDSIMHYEKEIAETKKRYFDKVIKIGPAYLLRKELKKFSELVDQLEEDDKIPPPLTPKHIKELIAKGICICNRPLEKKHKEILQNFIDNEKYEDTQIYTDGRVHVNYLLNDVDTFEQDIKILDNTIEEFENLKKSAKIDFEDIEEKLGDIDIDELQVIQQSLIENRIKRDKIIEQKGGVVQKLTGQRSSLIKAQRKETRLLQEESASKLSAKKALLINETIDRLTEYGDEYLIKIREEIQKETNNLFQQMIWKKNVFDDLSLNDQFRFKVVKDGLDSFGTLSAGERQTLAFAFIGALSKVARIENPLVIDTPFGRIDEDPTEMIATALNDYLKNFQMTFLMTHKEFSENIKEIMKPRIGKYYELDFDIQRKSTTMKENPL